MDILTIIREIPFEIQQGLLAAGVATLGYLLIRRLPKHRFLFTALLLAFITPLATLGFWFSTGDRGISDWDYYFSLHTTHRETLLEYGQLPHWNPYICGGTAGLADPEFRLFTPTFLLQLAFGIPVGFRLAIWLSVGATAVGMLFLSRKLKLSLDASFLVAIAASFGSVSLLEIVEGHPNIFSAMFIPWIFWAWYSAYIAKTSKVRWYMATGAFLALTFFQGGIYLLMYTAFAFLLLPLLAGRRVDALKTTIFSGLWGFGFAAVKIIPVLLWLSQFQDNMYASSALTLPYLNEVLFGRHLHGAEDVIPNQGSGWHEYGAYIGYGVGLLALIGSIFHRRRRLMLALAVAATLAVLLSSTGPNLKPLFDQASFLPRSNISRVILFGILPLSLLAGFGLDVLKTQARRLHKKATTVVVAIILLVITADLFSLAYALSEQAFVLPVVVPEVTPAPYPIGYTMFEYKTRHMGHDYDRSYDALIRGYGTFTYCSVLTPTEIGKPLVRTIHDEEDNEIISIKSKNSRLNSYELISWTPNIVTVEVTLKEPADIVLNTNYAKGWFANDKPADELAGLVSTAFETPGTYTIVYEFRTPGLPYGAVVSLMSVLAAGYVLRHSKEPDTQDPPSE